MPEQGPPSAEALRMRMLEREMEKMRREEAARERARQEHAAFADRFLNEHLGDAERAMIRRIVEKAVADGRFEALIYSFPSELCSDGGRAINAGDPGWPDTLRGKARELYDGYEKTGRPNGYRLKAMIVSFPNGMPGDVGFFLSWAPPTA